ncbi:MAG: malectin domain-containing carbohydrate-binding protein [Pleurocapsa sp. MO_226.B13]|nr:malectin domain-containing carbohydrate-binding protein [Pleurocapsa sp. MO_226.B13]
MSKNYSFDLIADTSGAISGFENTTSINDSGFVAAIAQSDSLEDLLVGDGESPINNLTSNFDGIFSPGIEINNNNKVVARDGGGFSAIRLWDTNNPNSRKTIATGAFGNEFVDFDTTFLFPRLNNNSESDQVVFLADPKGGSQDTALVTFAGENFGNRTYNEILLSNDITKPAIADDGTIVIKDFGEKILEYDYQLNLTDVIASSFRGFSLVGESPGISDEGGAIVFYGNLTNPDATSMTQGLESGEGIFVSIETDAGRKIERIAGVAGNGILDPGETFEDANENGEVDLGEDIGLIGSFSTDERDRFGINFDENISSGNIVFLAKDELGQESIINSNFKISTDEETILTTVKPQLVAKVGQEASEIRPDLTGNIQDLHIYDPINKSGQIAFWAETTTSEEAVIRANPIRKPVFVLPGIGGSFPQSNDFGRWLLNRGVAPDTLEIDYLANTYDDLIQTLENAGYQQGVDLFVATYDWRLNPGPIDGAIDGAIQLSPDNPENAGEILTDDTYEYAVDQLGFWLEEAITGWKSQFSDLPEAEIPELDSVDIIAHSTGGLVARSYIQSDAYGATFTDDNGEQVNLPTVNNFISIGVPNRGASQAWRPTQNDFYSRKGLNPVANQGRFLLRTILSSAYEKATRDNNPATIALSGDNNSEFAIDDPNISALEFVEQYVPTLKALSATYPSIDALSNNGNLQTIEEIDPSQRNNLLLDLNNGYDSVAQGTATDPNLFVDDVELATIIYGENENTDDAVEQKNEPKKVLGISQRTVHPIENSFAQVPDGIWYEDREGIAAKNTDSPNLQGDGTVPRQSSFGQFENDSRPNLITQPFRQNKEGQQGNTDESVDHGALVSNTDVQKFILETLGINNVEEDTISTGLAKPSAGDAFDAIRNITFDPVEGFLIDGQGRRLGYTEATGAITEIPGSLWLGSTDGFGFIPDTVEIEGPFQLELTGLGEDYYVSVALETEDGLVGIEAEGFLAAGEELTLDVPVNNAPVIDLNGDTDGINATASISENGGTTSITDSNLTIFDSESQNLAGATVTIQNPEDGNFELLGATATGNITVNYDASTSTLTLDGTDTITNYQQVLSSVTYTNNATNPNTTPREIELNVNDGASFNNFSTPATTNISFLKIIPVLENAGGDEYVDLSGQLWQATQGFTSGRTFFSTNPISQTEDDFLYQSEHIGRNFNYTQAVPNGSYDVTLHFAEIFFDQSGKRVFDVTLEDQLVLDDFDIYERAGGKDIALEQTFNVNVSDESIDLNFLSSVDLAKISAIEIKPFSSITRTNAGGGKYTDISGQLWQATQGFTGDRTFSNNNLIAQTEDDFLYQSEHNGQDFSYTQTVPNGSYDVTLHFAEIFFNQSGKRVFDVTLEDQLVLDDFDIYTQAGGKDIALEKTFNVNVSDGSLDLDFLSSVNLAKISAIEIEETTTQIRTNAGGDGKSDISGQLWQATQGFTGDRTFSNTNPIAQTEDDFLYQSEHNGQNFSYTQTVPNGSYDVTLHFAEIFFNQSGKRVFDVSLEDQLVLDDFDIYDQAGGKDLALEKTFNVNVTDGSLDLDFLSSVDLAKISAIEIEETTTQIRTNAGGDGKSDISGQIWQASIGFSNDRTFSNNNPIAQTEDDFLYQSEHNGQDFSYSQEVTNGSYDVTLHFAEIFFNQSGKRVFDVTLEDQLVLDDFDIYAQAGGKNIALERTFNVNVSDGSLDLDFLSSVDLAKISAIEISASDF